MLLEHPAKYKWVIPIPGDWHWQWHILKGIYKIFGNYIIAPFATKLKYKSVDLECKNFHYGEDLLQIIILSILKWIRSSMIKLNKQNPLMWLHRIKPNSNAYELAYACIWYFVPYWITRSAIKFGSNNTKELWHYWLHLFLCAGKHNYTRMTIWYLWILKSLNREVKLIFDSIHIFSFTGNEGTGMAINGFNELISYFMLVTNKLHHDI